MTETTVVLGKLCDTLSAAGKFISFREAQVVALILVNGRLLQNQVAEMTGMNATAVSLAFTSLKQKKIIHMRKMSPLKRMEWRAQGPNVGRFPEFAILDGEVADLLADMLGLPDATEHVLEAA